jgi:hypothetical protein
MTLRLVFVIAVITAPACFYFASDIETKAKELDAMSRHELDLAVSHNCDLRFHPVFGGEGNFTSSGKPEEVLGFADPGEVMKRPENKPHLEESYRLERVARGYKSAAAGMRICGYFLLGALVVSAVRILRSYRAVEVLELPPDEREVLELPSEEPEVKR